MINGKEQTLTVRDYLNELGLGFDNTVKYVRVGNYDVGTIKTYWAPGMSLDTMQWRPVSTDLIDLYATTLTVMHINIGKTGIFVNGSEKDSMSCFMNLGNIKLG